MTVSRENKIELRLVGMAGEVGWPWIWWREGEILRIKGHNDCANVADRPHVGDLPGFHREATAEFVCHAGEDIRWLLDQLRKVKADHDWEKKRADRFSDENSRVYRNVRRMGRKLRKLEDEKRGKKRR